MYTYFDCIWHVTSLDHPAKISSNLYSLISYGCHIYTHIRLFGQLCRRYRNVPELHYHAPSCGFITSHAKTRNSKKKVHMVVKNVQFF